MKKKPWMLSRRDCLRGVGATLALPFLEAMAPASRLSAASSRVASLTPTRFMALYFPHGLIPNLFWPTGSGTQFTLPPMLNSLVPYQPNLTMVKGFNNVPGDQLPPNITDDGNGIHARHTGSYLTAVPLKANQQSDGGNAGIGVTAPGNGVSVDQLIVQNTQFGTPVQSLVLGVQGGDPNSVGEDEFSGVYMNNISWASGGTYVPQVTSPQTLFDTLTGFISVGAQANPQLVLRRQFECTVMNAINGQANTLMNRLGTADRSTLDQFLTSVSELEKRCNVSNQIAQCTPQARPAAGITTYQADLRLMLDLAVMAFRCDMTRVATMMFSGAFAYRDFSFIKASSADPHGMTHDGDDADWSLITTWTFQQYAYLLGQLQNTPDVGGTLLDNSIIYIGSEFGNGSSHDSYNLPVIVAGKGGGLYQPGRYNVLPQAQPRANLYLSFLHDMGVNNITTFGDSTAEYTGIRS